MRSTAERSARPRRSSGSAETAPTAASPRAASRWTRPGRVYIAGGPNGVGTGRPDLWVYSAQGTLLAALRAPGNDVFLNDVAIGPDGAAYFTNSNDPQVFRVADDGSGWRASLWADATDTIDREDGFNLGGIVLTADRSAFVVAQGNVGRLWRFSTGTAAVSPVETGDADLTNADGLVRQGNRLTVVRNFSKMIATLRLTHDGRRALLLDQEAELGRTRPHHRQGVAGPDPVRRQQVRRGRGLRPVRGHHGSDAMKRVVLAALPLALVVGGCGGGGPTTSPEPSPERAAGAAVPARPPSRRAGRPTRRRGRP